VCANHEYATSHTMHSGEKYISRKGGTLRDVQTNRSCSSFLSFSTHVQWVRDKIVVKKLLFLFFKIPVDKPFKDIYPVSSRRTDIRSSKIFVKKKKLNPRLKIRK